MKKRSPNYAKKKKKSGGGFCDIINSVVSLIYAVFYDYILVLWLINFI